MRHHLQLITETLSHSRARVLVFLSLSSLLTFDLASAQANNNGQNSAQGKAKIASQDQETSAVPKKLDIIYAVNCGGEDHIDHFGVPYQS